MISPHDRNLFHFTTDIEDACREIRRFYGNYHSQRYVEGKLILRLKHEPSAALVAELNEDYADVLASGTIDKVAASDQEVADGDHPELPRLRLHFNRRSLGRLRALVDRLNAEADITASG